MIQTRYFKVVLTVLALTLSTGVRANVIWEYEDNWDADNNGIVDNWQSAQISFVPDNSLAPEIMAKGTILAGNTWGKAWSETGLSSNNSSFKYLFLDLASMNNGADVKVFVSGLFGAEEFNLTPFIVAQTNAPHNAGDPPVIFNGGKYVFDLSAWNHSQVQSNVEVKLITEGGAGSGFTVNRILVTDNWQSDLAGLGLVAIPECSTLAMTALGLAGMAGAIRRKRAA